ncbi:MAG TPA: hypothetical protein ENG51_15780 [Deltaproteobacteria bacterium]|nr:hypothetical protein [Deltaproteobacteria bacterium]
MTDREAQNVIDRRGMAFSEMIRSINAMNQSISQLTADVSSLKWSIPILVGLGITVISIIVGLK